MVFIFRSTCKNDYFFVSLPFLEFEDLLSSLNTKYIPKNGGASKYPYFFRYPFLAHVSSWVVETERVRLLVQI